MRVREHCLTVAGIAFVMVVGTFGYAQNSGCVQSAQTAMAFYAGSYVSKAPYSGTIKTTFEQRLADGNVIRAVIHTQGARDSSGKTMRQGAQGCARGENGRLEQRLSVQVSDPAAGTSSGWYLGGKDSPRVVQVRRQLTPPTSPPPPKPSTPEEIMREQKAQQEYRVQQAELQKNIKTENLGAKEINGVLAQGTRITRTIPAGEEGNEKPLVVVTERWESKDFGLILYLMNDDPRHGRTVEEYEDLRQGEPDPALFAPPAGYTVQEF